LTFKTVANPSLNPDPSGPTTSLLIVYSCAAPLGQLARNVDMASLCQEAERIPLQ
jgi:hypothetical protein